MRRGRSWGKSVGPVILPLSCCYPIRHNWVRGISLKGVDLDALTDLRHHDNLYWTDGFYRIHGLIDDDYALKAYQIRPEP